MRRLLVPLLFAALGCKPASPTAVPSSGSAAAAQRADERAPLRFAWPDGASASVTERILKKGRRATTTYRIVTERRDDVILVFYRDFRFVELEGVDLGDPQASAGIRQLEKQVSFSLPPYRVSPAGRWLGMGDLAALEQTFAGILPARDLAMIRQILAAPGMRALIEDRMRDVWRAWTEAWIGVDLEPGARVEGTSTVQVRDHEVTMPTVLEHLGADAEGVRLRMTTTLEGPEATAAVGEMLEEFGDLLPEESAGAGTTAERLQRFSLRRIATFETKLERATLRPLRAFMRMTLVVSDGQRAHEAVEEHDWSFVWDAAPRTR